MQNPYSMLQVMNAALLSQGEEQIVSLNDGSDAYRILSANWPLIIQAELEDGNYSFAREQAYVTTTTTGLFGYTNAYAIPTTALFVRAVWFLETSGNDQIKVYPEWIQDETNVYCNISITDAAGIYMEYMQSADETLWSANFTRGVQLKLEAVVARAMKEEYSEASALEEMAEASFQRARTLSSKSRSGSKAYKKGPIASSRFSRGYALSNPPN